MKRVIFDPETKSFSTKRGHIRSLIVGGVHGVIGTKKGKDAAIKAYDEGASSKEAIKLAKSKGTKYGAMSGAIVGGLAGAILPGSTERRARRAAKYAAFEAGRGALGGRLGASKAIRTHIIKSK